METLSDIVSWGERYLYHWEVGMYCCSRCGNALYSSEDKYQGPCVWPSFRHPTRPEAVKTRTVQPYNSYTVVVKEVYCGGCELFLGHQFEDAKQKGDTHKLAHWRAEVGALARL
ncbi:Mss4-like protein [Ochromonadaceae sp. CCMP2298]|nr:Mss4-like protein [Ochromonadaceae sp. CCMP2298]